MSEATVSTLCVAQLSTSRKFVQHVCTMHKDGSLCAVSWSQLFHAACTGCTGVNVDNVQVGCDKNALSK